MKSFATVFAGSEDPLCWERRPIKAADAFHPWISWVLVFVASPIERVFQGFLV